MLRKRTWFATLTGAALGLAVTVGAYAASVTEDAGVWIIETDQYTVHFKTAAQAGYSQIFPAGGGASLFGAGQGRNLYHSANYAGWTDWGAAATAEVVEQGGGRVVMHYVMEDGNMKIYDLTATYWDGAPYWKHELTIEAQGSLPSFSDGHEPMVEPRNGVVNEFMDWTEPFAHLAFANGDGFFAMYSETGATGVEPGWAPDGRMQLLHNDVAQDLNAGDRSDPLVFYLATGTGGLGDATALAPQVTDVPTAVDAQHKLATSWGSIKSQ